MDPPLESLSAKDFDLEKAVLDGGATPSSTVDALRALLDQWEEYFKTVQGSHDGNAVHAWIQVGHGRLQLAYWETRARNANEAQIEAALERRGKSSSLLADYYVAASQRDRAEAQRIAEQLEEIWGVRAPR